MSKMVRLTLVIVRHGQTEGNVRQIMDGQCGGDFSLTEKGREQADLAADRLKEERFDLVYCSDAARARQTAEAIIRGNKSSSDQPFQICTFLREKHFGVFEGMTVDEFFQAQAPGFKSGSVMSMLGRKAVWEKDVRGGESIRQLRERGEKYLERLFADARSCGRDPMKALAVSHGGFIKEFLCYLVEDCEAAGVVLPGDHSKMFPPNTGVTEIHFDLGGEGEAVRDVAKGAKCPVMLCGKHLPPDV